MEKMNKKDLLSKCRRCGKSLDPGKLWCKICGDKIREELGTNRERPFEYYFRYYLRHRN